MSLVEASREQRVETSFDLGGVLALIVFSRRHAANQLAAKASALSSKDKQAEAGRVVAIEGILEEERPWPNWPESQEQRLRLIEKELGHCGITPNMFPLVVDPEQALAKASSLPEM